MDEILRSALTASNKPVSQSLDALYKLMANEKSHRIEVKTFLLFAAQRRRALRRALDEFFVREATRQDDDDDEWRRTLLYSTTLTKSGRHELGFLFPPTSCCGYHATD